MNTLCYILQVTFTYTNLIFFSLASYSAYYYGSTSLWGGKKGKRAIVRNTWTLRHSLLQFRGKIFEWGLGKSKTYSMTRALGDCKIRWSWGRKGESRCLLSDAENWTRRYRSNYGSYKLLSNNCHHFVNRLGRYLASNCGR